MKTPVSYMLAYHMPYIAMVCRQQANYTTELNKLLIIDKFTGNLVMDWCIY